VRLSTFHPDLFRRGVVLLTVLVIVVLLTLAAYQYSELMTAEYKAADSAVRAAQARALAASGVHYAAAVLSDSDTLTGTLNNNPFDNEGMFRGIEVAASDSPRFHGKFSLVNPPSPDLQDSTDFKYGVSDEAGKININALLSIDSSGTTAKAILMKLPNMTDEIADAILDWIDADDDVRDNGAENEYYSGLAPPYRAKNGPLDSLEELLLVRGVTPELLFGTDRNRNGLRDTGEEADSTGQDRGWSAYLTVYTREKNVDSTGQPRVYLNDKDVNGLYQKLTAIVDADVADFIIAYRLYGPYTASSGGGSSGGTVTVTGSTGGSTTKSAVTLTMTGATGGGGGGNTVTYAGGPVNHASLDMTKTPKSLSSVFALINAQVGVTRQTGGSSSASASGSPLGGMIVALTQSTNTQTTVYSSPLKDPSKLRQFLPLLLDKTTTRTDAELPARVNLLTAPQAVLATLPNLQDTDVQTIIDRRPQPGTDTADPLYQTSAWLVTDAGLSPTTVQALDRYVTGRSQVYRVQSLGYFEKGGPTARIEAVIDTNNGKPRIVYWRDLSELGRGYSVK